jgi:hypothetical protein
VALYAEPSPNSKRIQWDCNIQTFEYLAELDSTTRILRTVTKSLYWGMISSRDFVDVVSWNNKPDGSLLSVGEFLAAIP